MPSIVRKYGSTTPNKVRYSVKFSDVIEDERKIEKTPKVKKVLNKSIRCLVHTFNEDGEDASSLHIKTLISLGAHVENELNPSVTHYICSNVPIRYILAAQLLNIKVLSPLWIEICQESSSHINEKDFELTQTNTIYNNILNNLEIKNEKSFFYLFHERIREKIINNKSLTNSEALASEGKVFPIINTPVFSSPLPSYSNNASSTAKFDEFVLNETPSKRFSDDLEISTPNKKNKKKKVEEENSLTTSTTTSHTSTVSSSPSSSSSSSSLDSTATTPKKTPIKNSSTEITPKNSNSEAILSLTGFNRTTSHLKETRVLINDIIKQINLSKKESDTTGKEKEIEEEKEEINKNDLMNTFFYSFKFQKNSTSIILLDDEFTPPLSSSPCFTTTSTSPFISYPFFSPTVLTHVIIPSGYTGRTYMMLYAMSNNLLIVEEDWILASLSSNKWLDPYLFLPKKYQDKMNQYKNSIDSYNNNFNEYKNSKKINYKTDNSSLTYNLNISKIKNYKKITSLIALPTKNYCFRGQTFCILSSNKMEKSQLMNLIYNCGGIIVDFDFLYNNSQSINDEESEEISNLAVDFFLFGDNSEAEEFLNPKSNKSKNIEIINFINTLVTKGGNRYNYIDYFNDSKKNKDKKVKIDSKSNNLLRSDIITIKYVCNIIEESYGQIFNEEDDFKYQKQENNQEDNPLPKKSRKSTPTTPFKDSPLSNSCNVLFSSINYPYKPRPPHYNTDEVIPLTLIMKAKFNSN